MTPSSTAVFSSGLFKKLSPTQQCYEAGESERLAIKWTLEDWQYWLQGIVKPSLVWTNHQNLIHIQQAKKLNPSSQDDQNPSMSTWPSGRMPKLTSSFSAPPPDPEPMLPAWLVSACHICVQAKKSNQQTPRALQPLYFLIHKTKLFEYK